MVTSLLLQLFYLTRDTKLNGGGWLGQALELLNVSFWQEFIDCKESGTVQ